MKIHSFYLLSVFLFISCSDHVNNIVGKDYLDSLNNEKRMDSLVSDRMKEVFLSDTLLISEAPVQITSTKVTFSGGIKLKYKNVSDKTITAIKFAWYGIDGFYDPVDLGSNPIGAGGGYTDETLSIGAYDESYWSTNSDKLKSIIKAWPIEVAFEDGSKWKIKK